MKKSVLSKLKLNSWLKGRSCHHASLHRAQSSSVYACLLLTLSLIYYFTVLVLECTVTFTHNRFHLSLHHCPGGTEQRKAKLGAPKRRPSCPDHSGRFTGQSWAQDEESSGRGQEAPRTCREYLTHRNYIRNNRMIGLHMAHRLHPSVSFLFRSKYRPREHVGFTPSGVEKQS